MKQYVRYGNQFYTQDEKGSLSIVQDPDTNKALKAGQLPYSSTSIDRSLTFADSPSLGSGNQTPSPYYQQGNTQNLNAGGTENQVSTSLKGGDDINAMFKNKFMEVMNGLTSSKVPGLQARQKQIQTQMLTAPSPDLSQMTPQAGTQALNNRGQEYSGALDQVTQAIGQEKSYGNDQLQQLNLLLSMAKTLSPEAEKSASIIEYEYAKKQGFVGSFESWKKKSDSTGALTTAQIQSTLNQIAGQFDNEAIVKRYNTIAEGYQFSKLVAEKKNPTSSDDQGLVYSFAKAMDPDSVVRESEYDTVQKYSQSLIQRGWIDAKRMLNNEPFLTAEGRKNMLSTINSKYKASEVQYKNIYAEYNRRIDDVKAGKISGSITDYSRANENIGGDSSGVVETGTVRMKGLGGTFDVPFDKVEIFKQNDYTEI